MSLPNIEIPEVLKEPIDEIKTPSNKILILCLIIAIIAMASVIIYLSSSKDNGYKEENRSLKIELKECIMDNTKLRNDKADHDASEIRRLLDKERYFDSILNKINNLKNN